MSKLKFELLKDPPAGGSQSFDTHTNDIFHTREFHEIFVGSKSADAVGFIVTEDQHTIGYFNAVKMKATRFLPSRMQSRYTIFASPLLHDSTQKDKFYEFMLPEIARRTKKECLFVEWRNSEDPAEYASIFEKYGWTYLPYQNYLINLNRNIDEIWNSIDKEARRNINKAKSKGVSTRTFDVTEMETSYQLISDLYEQKGLPLFDKMVFEKALHSLIPKEMMRATFAVYQGKIIGTRLALLHNGTVFDWYAASDRTYRNCYPNEALAWDMIEYGAKNGYKVFDFGGAGIRGKTYGPAKFKEKFKGQLVEYGRFQKTFRPRLFNLFNYLFEKRKELAGS